MNRISKKPELWPIGHITPYELNVKKHEREQVARICESINKFGFDVPIVVDKHGVIIKGHGRRLAAIELGMKEVPVIVRDDLTPEQVRAARLADNRVAQGDIDSEILKMELEGIESLLGGIFDAKEIDFMTADLGEVNADAFVEDMDKVLDEQKRDMDDRARRAAEERVPLSKAFGFKDVPASAQIHITRLVAKAQQTTGLEGGDAVAVYMAAL